MPEWSRMTLRDVVIVDHVIPLYHHVLHVFGSSAVDLNDLSGSRKKIKKVRCYKR